MYKYVEKMWPLAGLYYMLPYVLIGRELLGLLCFCPMKLRRFVKKGVYDISISIKYNRCLGGMNGKGAKTG